MAEAQANNLYLLARLYGVETAYRDFAGRPRRTAPHSLLAVLRALGAPVESPGDVPGALRERRQELWRRCSEPVAVVWDGQPGRLELRLPAELAEGTAECRLELEDGETRRWPCRLARLPGLRTARVEGVRYVVRQVALPPGLPWGYHRFTLSLPGCAPESETLIISAPRRAYTLPAGSAGRIWGVFLPLYALHSRRSWGAGDLTDLRELLLWVRELGGSFAGTLPLLAAFLDDPYEPSPYVPVSRLFWNEFYLDVARAEELKECPEARELLDSAAFQEEITALQAAPLVDHRRTMAAKRRILELLARRFFAGDAQRQAALRRWAAEKPAAEDYARFRAAGERRRAGWPAWPDRPRAGDLREGDYDPEVARYHLYVQWLAHEQFRELAARTRQPGQGLYLDLPLGVHPAGYDVWRERAAFAPEVSCGAPPDAFFTRGQDWGFPPLHPERLRDQGYRYYRACLRHHLQHAAVLRLDHVMGLHRLFWVPRGMSAREGVYVHYRAEEFYAILALESQRHRTLLVGEDLGTVPPCVRPAMARHRVSRMYVLPFAYTGDTDRALRPVTSGVLACLNTHDMPPFKAFWLEKEKNAQDRVALPLFLYRRGWLDVPTNNAEAVLRACLRHLAASRARLLSVNLEDLWLETEPQNVPGTQDEYPNWRRKARYPLEEFSRRPEVVEALREVDQLRKINCKEKTKGK